MENLLDLKAMPLDDLWALHERISNVLSARIIAEKQQLEDRLLRLNRAARESGLQQLESSNASRDRPRRKYPRVFPKYQNPEVPGETWSGRGKKPRWLASALKDGGSIEDFEIPGPTRDKIRVRR